MRSAAGMHAARSPACIVFSRFLLNRQSVSIRPKRYCPPGFRSAENGHNTAYRSAPNIRVHVIDFQRLQSGQYSRFGFRKVKTDLRIRMQRFPHGNRECGIFR